jgi:hypothetical protein
MVVIDSEMLRHIGIGIDVDRCEPRPRWQVSPGGVTAASGLKLGHHVRSRPGDRRRRCPG